MIKLQLFSEEERQTTLRGYLAGLCVMISVPLSLLFDESGLGALMAFLWCIPWSFAVAFFSTMFFSLKYWENEDKYFGGWPLLGRIFWSACKAVLLKVAILCGFFCFWVFL